ncbi:structural maintenance of chromosomes protein 6A [Zostera marina]|uniref:Structural maintenance of chromosomes protein 6A n=1 Tax=Zostera marina TaxID=29655 RepID=A0A0K9P278_ZOSMR|nr:structural maintenance of chromosomes protein 6A [Zostera marina]
MKRKKDELEESISVVKRKQYELQEKVISKTRILEKLSICLKDLHQQIHDVQEQYNKSTQALFDVESIHKDDLKRAQIDIDSAQSLVSRLTDEETTLFQQLSTKKNTTMEINKEIEEFKKNVHEKSNQIRMHQQCQNNKVTAFGGDRVLSLLQAIEKHHREFRRPPIGPIGVHVKLIDGDFWALAIENAIGRMLDAFIVTDSKDAGVLRKCANEANYRNVQILIYNFSTRLSIPTNMLPSTRHPTIYSVLNCDSPVVQNILVDMKHIERTVLVDNYDSGKEIVFKQHIQNLSDVFTSNGTQLFFRNSVETTLPPNRRCKTGRLCGSVEEHISKCENDIMRLNELIDQGIKRKRSNEDDYLKINARAQDVKRQRFHEQSLLMSKQNDLKSMKDSYAVESSANPAPPVEEVLHRQILDIQNKMDLEKASMDNIKHSLVSTELKDKELMLSFEKLCDLAKGDIDAIDEAEKEFSGIEQNISQAQEEKTHYERFMNDKVLPTLREAKDQYESLKRKRQEDIEKASIICPESDVITLGGCAGKTPEQLSAQLSRIKKRLHLESVGCPESIDDLRILHGKKQRKIAKKQQIYNGFHEKLNSCQKALDFRWTKFKRNASLLKRELTWQFNGHLSKKGISGQINVNYDEKTLSVEVKMPQDTSHKTVRDTRGLSGGERSFSTLCFALALHGMTESPFRAMDEFDVFMDAVSRKISMDTLVDFALLEGSQWILITPHDTSIVKSGSKIKKQQMEAPRA